MCWNLDEEKMSRAAAFITDCSRDRRYDEAIFSVTNQLVHRHSIHSL